MARNSWFVPPQVRDARLQGNTEKLKAMGRAGGLASAAKRKAVKAKAEREAAEAACHAQQLEDFRRSEQDKEMHARMVEANEHISPLD